MLLEGIRGDIAFAQSILETGFFAYGKDVFPEQNNYSGIGAVGGGAEGAYFSTPEEGVRAQIQHLKAYANKEPLVTELIDPRFHLVTRGVAPYWVDLNNRWAVPGEQYGERVLDIYEKIKEINLTIPNVADVSQSYLPVAVLYLKADRPFYAPDGSVHRILKKGYNYRVYGTIGNRYNLGGGYTVDSNNSKMSLYIGRLNIKNENNVLYKPDGRVHRPLARGENVRVYSFDGQQYYVGGGYYIKRSNDVSFYKGTVTIKKDTILYNRNGETIKTLKKGQQFRVYSISGKVLDLGGGSFITFDKEKQDYNNL